LWGGEKANHSKKKGKNPPGPNGPGGEGYVGKRFFPPPNGKKGERTKTVLGVFFRPMGPETPHPKSWGKGAPCKNRGQTTKSRTPENSNGSVHPGKMTLPPKKQMGRMAKKKGARRDGITL